MAKKAFVTPIAPTIFVHLNTPDDFGGRKKWTLSLVLNPDSPEFIDFRAKIQAHINDICKEAGIKVPAFPAASNKNKEGVEDGNVLMKFWTYAAFNSDGGEAVPNRVPVVDTVNNPVDLSEVVIGSGTTARVKFSVATYQHKATKKTGVTLNLLGVQVKDIVSLGSDPGFDALEDEVSTSNPTLSNDGDDDLPF